MRYLFKRATLQVLCACSLLLASGVASAQEAAPAAKEGGYSFGLAFTIGEGMYFVHSSAYRGPVSLEVVPSFGWTWLKLDLGLSTTLESIEIAGTNWGHWNWTFRPGARITPPMVPLYFRFAVPLQIQRHDFDYGLMFGLGADIPIVGILGIVLEADTTLSKNLGWGGDGVPLEFRAGISLHF